MHKRLQTGTHTAAAFPFKKELGWHCHPRSCFIPTVNGFCMCPTGTSLKMRQGVGCGVLAFLTKLIGSEEAKFAIQRARLVLNCSLDREMGEKEPFPHLLPAPFNSRQRYEASQGQCCSRQPRWQLSTTQDDTFVTHTAVLEQPGCHLLAHHQTYHSCLITTFVLITGLNQEFRGGGQIELLPPWTRLPSTNIVKALCEIIQDEFWTSLLVSG